ncbi:glycosyltransferase family 61 protein [Ningiella sp. W23]|uniref:glycosyltransferase family 61 protein n=1 Tax=Ningiella sp. W23 TaxID=3023715 RepID=UPI0037571EF9
MSEMNEAKWAEKASLLLNDAKVLEESGNQSEAEERYLSALKYDYYNEELRAEVVAFYERQNRITESSRIAYKPQKIAKPIKLRRIFQDQAPHNLFLSKRLAELELPESQRTYNASKLEITEPFGFHLLPEFVKQHSAFAAIGKTFNVPEIYLRCFANAKLSGNGAFVTGENEFFNENRVNSGSFLRHVVFHPLLGFIVDEDDKPTRTAQVAFYFQRHPMLNYYHLITEQAPQLLAYKKHLQKFGVKVTVIKNQYAELIQQVLDLLEIPDESVQWINSGYIVSDIVYRQDSAAHKNDDVKFITPATIDFFKYAQEVASEELKDSRTRRLFISREDTPKRAMENEQQVFELLKDYGFEKVILSGLSLMEQIALFGNAEAVVGAHGAGLTNIGFCKPDTFVLEISRQFTLDRVRIFWDIATAADLQYAIVSSNDKIQDHAAPFNAPIEQIKSVLDARFIKTSHST